MQEPEGRLLQPSDGYLVEQSRRGNATAFAELVRRHERPMLALAYACTRCSSTSADVVQEAFVKCWQRLADLREVDKFVPWLASAVRRLSANAMRSPSRRLKLVGDAILGGAPAGSTSDSLEAEDLANTIDRAIGSLDRISAECVMLRYFQDMSSKEIANITGLTPAAVDMRLSRARAILKQKLEPIYKEDSGNAGANHARLG